MTNPTPNNSPSTTLLERFYGTASYAGLAGVVSLTGLLLVSPVLLKFSHSQVELAIAGLTMGTAIAFVVYTLMAWLKSSDQQISAFSNNGFRQVLALFAALGVYCCEALSWVLLSDLAKPFRHGSSGGAWLTALLFVGALCGMWWLVRRYHQLVWPLR